MPVELLSKLRGLVTSPRNIDSTDGDSSLSSTSASCTDARVFGEALPTQSHWQLCNGIAVISGSTVYGGT